MSIQGVFNTRLSEKIGLYESNVFVQGTAFLLSIVAVLIMGKGGFKEIFSVEKYYLLGGVLGLVITITVMLSFWPVRQRKGCVRVDEVCRHRHDDRRRTGV